MKIIRKETTIELNEEDAERLLEIVRLSLIYNNQNKCMTEEEKDFATHLFKVLDVNEI